MLKGKQVDSICYNSKKYFNLPKTNYDFLNICKSELALKK